MGKPTICIDENKGTDQVTAKLISAFVFATRIVHFLFYLNPKFQASSSLLLLCSPVCVGPGRKPQRFSHEGAHLLPQVTQLAHSTETWLIKAHTAFPAIFGRLLFGCQRFQEVFVHAQKINELYVTSCPKDK